MKVLVAWVLIGGLCLNTSVFSQTTFTEKDRELLIAIKTKLEANDRRVTELREDTGQQILALREDMNFRFEQIDKRFEQVDVRLQEMFNFFQLMIGALVAILVALIGFAYWDRRTIVRKAKEETLEDLNHKGPVRLILNVLKERSKTDAELERILKEYRLL
jgi:hypothetical protein